MLDEPFHRQEIAIHRHCMQTLLHKAMDAISREQDCCLGLLAGGSIIEKHQPVTKIEPAAPSLDDFFRQHSQVGIYLLVRQPSDLARLHRLAECVRMQANIAPTCYLILESTEKGRLEAHLFADEKCSAPLTLTLQEDGSLYPAVGNR